MDFTDYMMWKLIAVAADMKTGARWPKTKPTALRALRLIAVLGTAERKTDVRM